MSPVNVAADPRPVERTVATLFWALGTVGCALLFAGVYGAMLTWLNWQTARYPGGEGQSAIPVGFFLWFGGTTLAFLWAGADGWRGCSLARVLIRWVLTAAASSAVNYAILGTGGDWFSTVTLELTLAVSYAGGAAAGWIIGCLLPGGPGLGRFHFPDAPHHVGRADHERSLR